MPMVNDGVFTVNRFFRCTNNIAQLYMKVVYNQEASSLYPDHDEIHGELPVLLDLPKCGCEQHCMSPVEHLFINNKSDILNLLKEAQSKLWISLQRNPQMWNQRLTVIIQTENAIEECQQCRQ